MENKILIKLSPLRNQIDINNYKYIFTDNEDDNNDETEWNYISSELPFPVKLNNSFWIINNYIDNDIWKFNDEIQIDIDFSQISINNELIEIINDFNELSFESNILTIETLSVIRYPLRYWYKNGDEWSEGKNYLALWLYCLMKKNLIKSNSGKKKIDYLEDQINSLKKENKSQFNILKKSLNIDNYINGGNEGIIKHSDKSGKITKVVSKNSQEALLKKPEYKNIKVKYAEEKMINFNSFLNIQKNEDDEKLEYIYDNTLLPTHSFKASKLLNLLRKQWKEKIIITDVKIENFAKKYFEESNYSRLVYSDFGKSFVEFEDDKTYNEFFLGNVRDYFFFTNYYKSYKDYRKIIRDARMITKEKYFNLNLKTFYKECTKDRSHIVYLCHDELKNEIRDNISKYEFRICADSAQSNLYFERRKNEKTIYDLENEKICECDKNKATKLAKDLNLVKTSVVNEYNNNFKNTHDSDRYEEYKILGLITTTGKRDISKALKSMENQTRKLDDIIIASEVSKEFGRKTYTNNDKNSLSINTNQALIKIILEYKKPNERIFVASLDDDDFWKKDYIFEVEKLIKEGYNFIGTPIDVHVDGKYSHVEEPNNNDPNFYLIENDGLQGSNKVFDAELALENGSMFRTLESSTDRSLNINLLSDSRVRFMNTKLSNCVHNRDKNRERITNDHKRIESLRKFYKIYFNKLKKSDKEKINLRHHKLHGFKEVINW